MVAVVAAAGIGAISCQCVASVVVDVVAAVAGDSVLVSNVFASFIGAIAIADGAIAVVADVPIVVASVAATGTDTIAIVVRVVGVLASVVASVAGVLVNHVAGVVTVVVVVVAVMELGKSQSGALDFVPIRMSFHICPGKTTGCGVSSIPHLQTYNLKTYLRSILAYCFRGIR